MKNTGTAAGRSHRKYSFLLGLAVFTCGLSWSARGESDLNTCFGVDFDAKRHSSGSNLGPRTGCRVVSNQCAFQCNIC